MKPIGRSLPRLVLATIASLATRHHVSVSSDRVETRRGLLTGGLLVRVQPEEPRRRGTYRWRISSRRSPELQIMLVASPRNPIFNCRLTNG